MCLQVCCYCCLCLCGVFSTGVVGLNCGECIGGLFLVFLLGLCGMLYTSGLYPAFLELDPELVAGISGASDKIGLFDNLGAEMSETEGFQWTWMLCVLALCLLCDAVRKCQQYWATFYYTKLAITYYAFKYAFYEFRDLEQYIGTYTFAAERYFVYVLLLRAVFVEVRPGRFFKWLFVWQVPIALMAGAGDYLLACIGLGSLSVSDLLNFLLLRALIPGAIAAAKYGLSAFAFGWISAVISYSIDNFRNQTYRKAATEEHMQAYAVESMKMILAVGFLLLVSQGIMWVLGAIFGEVPWAAAMWFDCEIAYICGYLRYGSYPENYNDFPLFLSDCVAAFFSINVIRSAVGLVV